jgi:hypothetical protein
MGVAPVRPLSGPVPAKSVDGLNKIISRSMARRQGAQRGPSRSHCLSATTLSCGDRPAAWAVPSCGRAPRQWHRGLRTASRDRADRHLGRVLAALMLFKDSKSRAFASISVAPTLRDTAAHARSVIGGSTERRTKASRTCPLPCLTFAPNSAGRASAVCSTNVTCRSSHAAVGRDHRAESGSWRHDPGRCAGSSGSWRARRRRRRCPHGVARGRPRAHIRSRPSLRFSTACRHRDRALSAAVNDQATAVQVIDTIDTLIRVLCTRRLDVGRVKAVDGRLQVVIPVPSGTDCVDAAVSDIAVPGGTVVAVSPRLLRLLDELQGAVHPARQPPINRWRVI